MDKSVTGKSRLATCASSLSDALNIILGFGAKIADVQEVGIGDDHGPALADAAVGDQPVRADPAIAVESARAKR